MPDKTLLVVEDNPAEREALAAVLESEGYGVVSAANGKQALERLRGTSTALDELVEEETASPFRT